VRKRRYVLDSYPLLAYFQDEPAADRVEQLLEATRRGEASLYLSLINLGEVAYIIERRHGQALWHAVQTLVDRWPVQVVGIDRERVLNAAHIKAHYPISYADAFAVALAQELEAPVVTGDPEFHKVEEIVQVLWLS
jgi:predicted nucleic acid-binding protein